MSLSVETSVHCDDCGFWLPLPEFDAARRRRMDWTDDGGRGHQRRDRCAKCSRDLGPLRPQRQDST